ncbi:glycosyltransferase family 4 protein [Bacillus cereus]
MIIFFSTVYPYPKDNGKKIILSSMLEFFIAKYGAENILYVIIGSEEPLASSTDINVVHIKDVNKIYKALNVLVQSFFLRKKSIQEAILYNPQLMKQLKKVTDNYDPKLVVYDTVRSSQFFEGNYFNNEIEYVYLDDLFSVRYQKMLEAMENYPDVQLNSLGNFRKFVPKFAQRLVEFNFVNKFLLSFEKKMIYKREVETVNRFNNILLISDKESKELRNRTGKDNIYTVRPILYNSQEKYDRDYQGNARFIFLGALNIPHNDVSICKFIEKNMDNLIKDIPKIQLTIIGKNPSEELKKLVTRYKENVELLGYVEDLSKLFNESCAMIIPLLFGSGVKLKTLEALSFGLPVISTEFGVEGIDVHKDMCIVENDVEKFPQHMINLIDFRNNEKLSLKSYEFYWNNYSKEEVYKRYDSIFSRE